MYDHNVFKAFNSLKQYCESEGYIGWDPYDGLNSKVFQATPLRCSRFARLAFIQVIKRSPVNFRNLLMIPKGYNSKGIALFLTGYCNLYQLAQRGERRFGSTQELSSRIEQLADLLCNLRSNNYSGACWGYNFDWQSKAFFLPKHTPTVVATSFAVEALLNAFEITKNNKYLVTAVSAADFVLKDLNKINKPGGLFMFSYSPLDKQAVYNASLLGTKILSQIYKYTKDELLKEAAYKSALAVVNNQNSDGSFPHSDQVGQAWRDSFHTGFKLEALMTYQKLCNDICFQNNIEDGFNYWLDNYFDQETGYSFYYDRDMKKDLVDLHCASQAIVTFCKLDKSEKYQLLNQKICQWTIDNMQSKEGYFYFQKNRNRFNKIPYMRWPNAWMFYGISFGLLEGNKGD